MINTSDLKTLGKVRDSIIHNIETNNRKEYLNKSFAKKILSMIEDKIIECSANYLIENGTMHPDFKVIKNWGKPIGGKKTNNISISDRKSNFINECNAQNLLSDIGDSQLDKFTDYWTEVNKSGTKLRFEMRETFEISRRMATWKRNSIESVIEKKKKLPIEDRFKKYNTGLYEAFCTKCGNREMPTDKWQLIKGSTCCSVEYTPKRREK